MTGVKTLYSCFFGLQIVAMKSIWSRTTSTDYLDLKLVKSDKKITPKSGGLDFKNGGLGGFGGRFLPPKWGVGGTLTSTLVDSHANQKF